MKGWGVSGKSRHSNESKNKTGGHWVIRDGMIIANQDIPGNAGLFIAENPGSTWRPSIFSTRLTGFS